MAGSQFLKKLWCCVGGIRKECLVYQEVRQSEGLTLGTSALEWLFKVANLPLVMNSVDKPNIRLFSKARSTRREAKKNSFISSRLVLCAHVLHFALDVPRFALGYINTCYAGYPNANAVIPTTRIGNYLVSPRVGREREQYSFYSTVGVAQNTQRKFAFGR